MNEWTGFMLQLLYSALLKIPDQAAVFFSEFVVKNKPAGFQRHSAEPQKKAPNRNMAGECWAPFLFT